MPRVLPILLACALVLGACGSSTDDVGNGAPSDAVQPDPDAEAPGATPGDGAAPGGDVEPVWVARGTEGLRWSALVPGVLTFRGNPTRTYYGSGPMPRSPSIVWQRSGFCSVEVDPETGERLCGTGWANQPSVFERGGRVWLVTGTLDGYVHFLDAGTGEGLMLPFATGGAVKGTATIDPEGYPLAYVGSSDGRLRVIAFDRDVPTELWSLAGGDLDPVLFSDHWDGAPLVLGDHLFAGGENGGLHIVRLNRGIGDDGLATVDPTLVFFAPTWDDQLLADIGDDNVSVETSVSVLENTLWLANSAGRVQGWDIGALHRGEEPAPVFEFWTGDDTDASVVVDDEGYLYVGSSFERRNPRAQRVGQILKLDSSRPRDPVVWSISDIDFERQSGPIGTPAIAGPMVYASTATGRLLGIDRTTGAIVWEKQLGGKLWGSPVVVDGVLLQGDCDGVLWAFDVADPWIDPPEVWREELRGCIESTPTVWRGTIYVGTRAGELYALR